MISKLIIAVISTCLFFPVYAKTDNQAGNDIEYAHVRNLIQSKLNPNATSAEIDAQVAQAIKERNEIKAKLKQQNPSANESTLDQQADEMIINKK